MKKGILLLLALALIAGIAIPSYSAVTNVQVGGGITIYGAYRHNFTFESAYKTNDFLQTSAKIWVSAQLTSNVSAMVQLINERDWGQKVPQSILDEEGFGNSSDVMLDLAYIKLADIFTPGLNVTVGRQNLLIGEGFIIGDQYWAGNNHQGYPTNLLAIDLGQQTAFDAIKVDYKSATAPLSVQGFFAKINESWFSALPVDYDVDLYGASLLYAPDNWSIEPYIVNLYNDDSAGTDFYGYTANENLSTAGIRGTIDIPAVKGLSFNAEYAKQFGKPVGGGTVDYSGWAGYVGGEFKFPVPTNPYLMAQYTMYSGKSTGSSSDEAFVPMFPSDVADNVGLIAYADAATLPGIVTNGTGPGLKSAKLGFGFMPTDKLGVALNWFNLAVAESQGAVSDAIGNEVDLSFKYAYTEDVCVGLDLGTLARGDYIKALSASNTENPWEAVASLSVKF